MNIAQKASGEEEKEIFTREEIIEGFSIERVTKHAAVFDLDKLNWMNGLYIREASLDYLLEVFLEIAPKNGLSEANLSDEAFREYCKKVLAIMRERIKYLAQLIEEAVYFFREDYPYDEEAVEKVLKEAGARERLAVCLEYLKRLDSFTASELESVVRSIASELGVKAAKLIHPLRVAVSGKRVGPGLFELLEVLGKERVINRIERTLAMLS